MSFAIGLFAYRAEHAPLPPLPPLHLSSLSSQEVETITAQEVPPGSSPEYVEEWLKRRNLYGKWWYEKSWPQPPRYYPELSQEVFRVSVEFGGSDPRILVINFKDGAVDDTGVTAPVA